MLSWGAWYPSACTFPHVRPTPSDAKPTSILERAAESSEQELIPLRIFSGHQPDDHHGRLLRSDTDGKAQKAQEILMSVPCYSAMTGYDILKRLGVNLQPLAPATMIVFSICKQQEHRLSTFQYTVSSTFIVSL